MILRGESPKVVPALGLERWRPVLYMARHTGASLDRLEDRISLEEVRRRGRWASDRSVKRYEKRAMIQEVFLAMTAQQRRYADIAAAGLLKLLRRKLDGHAARSSRKMGRIA